MLCHICTSKTESIGYVKFGKNLFNIPVEDDTPIEYVKCTKCNSIFCPSIISWSKEDFIRKIYNSEYANYDPDYLKDSPSNRSVSVANLLLQLISNKQGIKHLDYGSGSGYLSELLNANGIVSTSYDPFSNNYVVSEKFNLVTAIEVIEHSSCITDTMLDILSKLSNKGVLLFTTLLSTKDTDVTWDYVLPRNGHISILGDKAISILAKRNGIYYTKLSDNLHLMQYNKTNAGKLFRW